MIDKTIILEQAISQIHDGATVMVGGFGVPGTPFALIDGLLESGVAGLTLIKNEANEDHMGLSKLIEAGRKFADERELVEDVSESIYVMF